MGNGAGSRMLLLDTVNTVEQVRGPACVDGTRAGFSPPAQVAVPDVVAGFHYRMQLGLAWRGVA